MKIPKFWIRREGDVPHPDGRELHLFAWGWSETSASDAEARAAERFRSLEQRVSQGLDLPRGYARRSSGPRADHRRNPGTRWTAGRAPHAQHLRKRGAQCRAG